VKSNKNYLNKLRLELIMKIVTILLAIIITTIINAQPVVDQEQKIIRPHTVNDYTIMCGHNLAILVTKFNIVTFIDSLVTEIQKNNPNSELWALKLSEESVEQVVDSNKTLYTLWSFSHKLSQGQSSFDWIEQFLRDRDPQGPHNAPIDFIYWVMDRKANSIVVAVRKGSQIPAIIKNYKLRL
jgi:hypothetical protein